VTDLSLVPWEEIGQKVDGVHVAYHDINGAAAITGLGFAQAAIVLCQKMVGKDEIDRSGSPGLDPGR